MAKVTKVKVQLDKKPKEMEWKDIVETTLGKNQLNDQLIRNYMNSRMVGTMTWGNEMLKQLKAVKKRAAANLKAGEKFTGEHSKYKAMKESGELEEYLNNYRLDKEKNKKKNESEIVENSNQKEIKSKINVSTFVFK